MKKHSYISSDPSIMRGALVIAGTRVPMERILYMVSEGFSIDEIHNHYPWVSKKIFKNAIAELATRIDIRINEETVLQTQNPAG
jgi:uncharacterized protein (DUF433 family)